MEGIMICSISQLLELITHSLAQATPEEKKLLRDESQRSLMQPPTPDPDPVWAPTDSDIEFLRALNIDPALEEE
jgi:hypothetical protein